MEIPKYIEVKVADKTAAFLSPQSDGLKDVFIDTRLNGESTLEFSLHADNEKNNELVPECEIYAGGRVFNLLKEEAVDDVMDESGKLWSKYMAIERWNELDNEYPEPYITNDPNIPVPADLAVIIVGGGSNLSGGIYTVGSAAHALYAVLKGSEWSMGMCDVTGIYDLEMEKVSRLQLIKQIQDIWGGYLVWDSVNKVVHLRSGEQWSNYTGFQVKYAKNLKHITRTQSNKLVTKLYCFGKDDLDIASVNGGKKYVTDFSYTSKVYTGIYSNPDIEGAAELKQKGIAELALNCKPKYNYQIKMVDLRTLPEYSHEEFALGDMADVLNYKMNIEANVRIMRHKYNVFQPWQCELELGDINERFLEKLKASFDTSGFIDRTFNSVGEMSGKKLVDGSVIANSIADAAMDASKFNTKQLILTGDIWNDNTPSGGYVSWNAHKLFYDGQEYTINSGFTNKKYIVWRKDTSKVAYQAYTQAEFDGIALKDYDWVIAVNNNGIHDIAWYSRLARQFIASVFIADAAIKTAKIEDAAIVTAKIAQLAVQAANIANAAITNAKINDLAVDTFKIGNTAITEEKLANLSVSTSKIKDLAITNAKIGNAEISTAKIENAAINTAKIANLAVTNAKIESLSADKITAGVITALISIMSPKIYGGRYYGPSSDSAYMEVGGNISKGMGDLTIYRGNGNRVFQIYDDGTIIHLRAHGGSAFMSVGEDRTVEARGNWDFTTANSVKGIQAVFA